MKTAPREKRLEVARRFKRLRKKYDLTQSDLAKMIDIDRTNISWIENGKRYPYRSTLERFAAVERRLKQGQELHAASK